MAASGEQPQGARHDMQALDWIIVLATVAYALAAGLRARRSASQGPENYFLAGRSLPGWKAGLSMAATQYAADTPLLVTGLVATAGVFALWRLWIYAVAFLLLGFVLAPCWRRARVLTDAELAELRYSGPAAGGLRGLKAVYFGTVFNCVVLAMVLWAAAEICEPFLRWNLWLPAAVFEPFVSLVEGVGVPLARAAGGEADIWLRSANNVLSLGAIAAVTLTYSASGGLRGVVQTDVMQLALMFVGTALYAGFVVAAVGGLDAIPERVAALAGTGALGGLSPSELLAFTPGRARDAGMALLAVLALQWLVQMNADGTGYLAQRSMACRSDADARQAAIVFTLVQVLLRSLLWLPIALGLLLLYPPDPSLSGAELVGAREATFVTGIADLLPTGARGLMLAALLAALASTIDTHLNWGASYWTNDLYARFWCRWRGREPSPRTLVRVARLSSVAILLLAMGIASQLASIQDAWQLSLLLGSGMGVMLVLRWLWWRVTAWGEIAAVACSALLAPFLLTTLAGPEHEAERLLWLAGLSASAGVAASLFGPAESRDVLAAFYRRARPPGFWGPIAGACGEPADEGPRRLRRGLGATLTASLAIFCCLISLGSWLIGSPAPELVPSRGLWIGGLLVAAGLLTFSTWRLAGPEMARRT